MSFSFQDMFSDSVQSFLTVSRASIKLRSVRYKPKTNPIETQRNFN